MADKTITPEVRDVLARTTIDGNIVKLPGQLPRELYEAVDKTLRNAGGRWKRGKGHLFDSDPTPKIEAMLSNGISVDEKKRDQAFFTSAELAAQVVEIADVKDRDVLEPEAGDGALVRACLDAGAKSVLAIEQNPEHAERIPRDPRVRVHVGDFLFLKPNDIGIDSFFGCVVMNPPFTRNQDVKHVQHAYDYWLGVGGRLVSIMLDNQSRAQFRDMLANFRFDEIELTEVERGAFKQAGTTVATLILTLDRDEPF